MRDINSPLPSIEESKIETQKRLKIVKEITPILEKFSEALILAGSVAYGKNFSVRKESDIDLIILITRDKIENILKTDFFNITPHFLLI